MPSRNFKQFVVFLAIILGNFMSAYAHEYWLDPRKYEIEVGETLEADLRNGENYKGNQLYYVDRFFTKFHIFDGETTHKIEGENGDNPAAKFLTTRPGLHILSYFSTFDTLSFKKWEKFIAYAHNQGLDTVVKRHLERGLPQDLFKEKYARTIKALVRVGDGNGQDFLTGLPYEFVAQKNPYILEDEILDTQFLPVKIFLDGVPQANRQVLIFQNNGEISSATVRSDSNGLINVPLKGGGKFMLSSVHMYEGDNDSNTDTPEWFSYWANLTFALPGADALLKK